MQPLRPSILHRPLKTAGKATTETADEQYKREQEKLSFKQARSSATHDRLLRSIYPTPEDKQAVHQDTQEYLEAHMIARMKEREGSAEWEAKWLPNKPPPAGAPPAVQVLAMADDRPWLHPVTVYRDGQDEKAARRRYEEQVAAANRTAAAEASLQRSLADEQGAQEARDALTQQNFWTRGATDNLGCPPQAVRKAAVLPPQQQRTLPPWATHETPPPRIPPTAGAAASRPPPYATNGVPTAYPRAVGVDAASVAHGSYAGEAAAQQAYRADPRLGPADVSMLMLQQQLGPGPVPLQGPYPSAAESAMEQQVHAGSVSPAAYEAFEGQQHLLCAPAPVAAAGVASAGGGGAGVPWLPLGNMQQQQAQVGARYACRPASATRTLAPWATYPEEVVVRSGQPAVISGEAARLEGGCPPVVREPIYPTAPAPLAAAGMPSGRLQQRAGISGRLMPQTMSVSEVLGGSRPASRAAGGW